MVHPLCRLFALVAVLLACNDVHADDRPNILLIMADDLGFSDLGCYGGEIETPNLDALAEGGVRFTQFYNTGRCWPTRASLLTGYYAQSIRRDEVPGIVSGGGNRAPRPDWAPLICRPLGDAGYRTYHTGKWHIDGMPIENGFDRSYYLLDQHRFFNPTKHWKDDQPLAPVEKETGYYATIALADHAIECLKEHADQYADRPFFHYLAFAAPHFPLHALPEDIDRYRERYKVGWEEIRQQRWQRIKDLGLVSATLSDVMPDVGPPYHFADAYESLGTGEVNRPIPWKELTDEQKEFQSTKMAIHAAMIDRMDREIGRVLDQVRAMDAWDNTLVMFLSDNGASAEIMVRGDGHDPSAPMGSWKSHLCLGPGWSTVCNTPFRYHKTWSHEGGTATPFIVHWPAAIEKGNQFREEPFHVIDVWPTVMDVSKIDAQHTPPRPGKSFMAAAKAETQKQSSPRSLWWMHENNRALRQGNWKVSAATSGDKRAGTQVLGPWELYRMDVDRTETNDLADAHPDKLAELTEEWERMLNRHIELATGKFERKD
tara:strand:+ start:40420 stop:42048 length:1629 start_codon:yes stop_codon:yes gene_type:complete